MRSPTATSTCPTLRRAAQRLEHVGVVRAAEHQPDAAAALAQPLGEGGQRRRGVPLTDEQAAGRLARQGERAAERPGDLHRRTGRQRGQRPAAGPARLDDDLDHGPMAAHRAHPVDPEGAAGEVAVTDRHGQEAAGPRALADAGRDQAEVVEGADRLRGEHLGGDMDRPVAAVVAGRPSSAEPADDPARPQRAAVDEAGVGLHEGRRPRSEPLARRRARSVTPPTEMMAISRSWERSRRSTSSERRRSTGPDRPPAPSGLDLGGRRAQAVARDRGVGGDQALETAVAGQLGDGDDVVVGQVGGDLHAERDRAARRRRRPPGVPRRGAAPSRSTACRDAQPGRVGRGDVDDEVVGVRREQARAERRSRRARPARRPPGPPWTCRC